MDALSWFTFAVIAALIVLTIVGVLRYWNDKLNMSDEDVALERRIANLNRNQANRRPDDEIVRLLSGDDARLVGDENER